MRVFRDMAADGGYRGEEAAQVARQLEEAARTAHEQREAALAVAQGAVDRGEMTLLEATFYFDTLTGGG